MSKDKSKAQNAKPQSVKMPVVKPVPIIVPPLFRKIDWLVLGITFAAVWTTYLFTLAPELTLEDCGELCTASFYAGIPHPPGYPFWTIYSWLWTAIVPFGNVAWRVELGESFAAAMACGLVGFMVSRGSSMLIEGIEELKSMEREWENAICIVTGIVAGLMLGFDGFLWKESVVINRISPFDVPWLMVVALCLLRWIYAPHQRRYLYIGMFFFGLCATIHQTMLVAAMGIEVCIAFALPRLGRDLLLGNSIIYALGLAAMATGKIPALNDLSPMFIAIFHVVGLGSITAGVWLSFSTRAIGTEWKAVVFMGLLWLLGAAFYFYEPLAGMTDPPMQWGYPRTVEGFFHALSRGQYEKANPTDIIHDPMRFIGQLWQQMNWLAESFSWVSIFIALLPFLFLFKMKNRERAWIIGLASIYFCVGVLLTIIMNTTPDRTGDENRAFFTASHAVVAIMIGYGLALMAAHMATHYEKFRRWGFLGGSIGFVLALFCLVNAMGKLYFGPAGGFASEQTFLLGIILLFCLILTAMFYVYFRRWVKSLNDEGYEKLFLWGLPIAIGFFALALKIAYPEMVKTFVMGFRDFAVDFAHSPFQIVHSDLPHWIAQAFAKDQYGLPVFANLILLAVPIVFFIALLIYRERGPVLILLCLLTALPAWSSLSHWYKSEQRNHWFGYWFGHDMFTPPFGIYPEMSRNTILFGGTDPGRFCPTYMIFCESFIPHRCQPYLDQKFDRRDVYLITQNALADGTYLDYLRAQYYRSQQKDPPFFSRFFRYIAAMVTGSSANVIMDLNNSDVGKGDTGNALIEGVASLLYKTLDVPFTALGAKIEARRRAQGVYPPNEIYIPSDEDSKDCFQRYTDDVARRQQLGQLKPGEDVHIDADGRVQVSGQVAVMEINGLLCEVIFQKNPTNDFYVEESFPLDWMYPYETPSGIIMKINRDPLPELTDDVFKKDHQFWSKYSDRLIGNWITYDTTVQEITDFAQKVYLGNNYAGFKGDRKFVRDDDAQKAFSKLRSSIAGMYAWRCGFPEPGSGTISCPPEYRQKTEAAQNALIRETDFAFKQAFAFCPYSPEAVFRYVNFLLQLNRLDDALMVAETCLKLDPFNDQVRGTVAQLQEFKKREAANAQLQSMQSEAITNPTDFKNILALGGVYAQMQDTNRAFGLLRQSVGFFDRELARPDARPDNITAMAQICAAIGDLPELEIVLQKLVALQPDQPEARYDLAALEAFTGKTNDALKNLGISIDLSSKRLLTNPAARNLANEARNDQRFNAIRNLPEFQKLVPPG